MRSLRRAASGSPTRSACSSAGAASASAAATSPDSSADQLRRARIRAERRRRPRPRPAPRRNSSIPVRLSPRRVEASSKRTSARSDPGGHLGEELLEDRDRPLAVAREAVEARRPQAPLPCQRRIVRRQLGGELGELGCRRGRPAGGGLLGRGFQLGGDGGVGAFGGERQVAGPLLDVRDRAGERPVHGAALPERRLLVADRGEQRMREPNLRASSSTTPSRAAASSASRTRSRSPCAAATSSTVGRASAATWSRTSSVSAGSRARRSPSSSRRLSGTRSAWPGAGRVSVRTSSRPSSSAKNGLPAVASCTRASSGRVSSSPSRSSSSRCSAPRLSGPSESCSIRSLGKRALELERARQLRAPSAASPAGRPARRAGVAARSGSTPAEAGSSHCRSSSATSTGPLLGQGAQHVEDGEPDRVWIRRLPRPARPAGARPRAPAGAAAAATAATSSKTGASRSESPANESEASASTPRQTRTRANRAARLLDARLPEDRLADPGLAGEDERAGALLDLGEERLDRAELLVAPDDRLRSCLDGFVHRLASLAASPARRTPSLR